MYCQPLSLDSLDSLVRFHPRIWDSQISLFISAFKQDNLLTLCKHLQWRGKLEESKGQTKAMVQQMELVTGDGGGEDGDDDGHGGDDGDDDRGYGGGDGDNAANRAGHR